MLSDKNVKAVFIVLSIAAVLWFVDAPQTYWWLRTQYVASTTESRAKELQKQVDDANLKLKNLDARLAAIKDPNSVDGKAEAAAIKAELDAMKAKPTNGK